MRGNSLYSADDEEVAAVSVCLVSLSYVEDLELDSLFGTKKFKS